MQELKEVRIEDIKVGKDRTRDRQSIGDLESLKASIESYGLLQPIVVNQENELVAGLRRLACCEELGFEAIKVYVIQTSDCHDRSYKEYAENLRRKNFNFSEIMKIADDIEPIVEKKSKERMGTKESVSITKLGLKDVKGTTRDTMADYLGFGSGTTYDRARNIWKSQNKEIISELDIGEISISDALQKVKELQTDGKEKPSASDNQSSSEINIPVPSEDNDNAISTDEGVDESQEIIATASPEEKKDDSDDAQKNETAIVSFDNKSNKENLYRLFNNAPSAIIIMDLNDDEIEDLCGKLKKIIKLLEDKKTTPVIEQHPCANEHTSEA